MSITALIGSAEGGSAILIPALPDLLWGTVSFIILLVAFSKFILPSFNKVLDERAEKIEGGMRRAEQAQAEAARALAEYTAQLESARTEAAAMRNAAADEKRHVIEEAKAEAVAAADAVHQRAKEQVAAERGQVAVELQKQIGGLALEIASKVVGDNLHDDERARAVVDRFIADLERQAAEAGR